LGISSFYSISKKKLNKHTIELKIYMINMFNNSKNYLNNNQLYVIYISKKKLNKHTIELKIYMINMFNNSKIYLNNNQLYVFTNKYINNSKIKLKS